MVIKLSLSVRLKFLSSAQSPLMPPCPAVAIHRMCPTLCSFATMKPDLPSWQQRFSAEEVLLL
jgi:hypothetical protein